MSIKNEFIKKFSFNIFFICSYLNIYIIKNKFQ